MSFLSRSKSKPADPFTAWDDVDTEGVRRVLRAKLDSDHPIFGTIASCMMASGIATPQQAEVFLDAAVETVRAETWQR
jgi:hypothetical protein